MRGRRQHDVPHLVRERDAEHIPHRRAVLLRDLTDRVVVEGQHRTVLIGGECHPHDSPPARSGFAVARAQHAARIYMSRERKDHTRQPTAVADGVFVRLVDATGISLNDRAHFFGICARLMRRVLVDHARSRGYQIRGGDRQRVTLVDQAQAQPALDVDLLDLDRALHQLESIDARKCRVVEIRFFACLSVEENAAALKVSTDTIKRDWRIAMLWLLKELRT